MQSEQGSFSSCREKQHGAGENELRLKQQSFPQALPYKPRAVLCHACRKLHTAAILVNISSGSRDQVVGLFAGGGGNIPRGTGLCPLWSLSDI